MFLPCGKECFQTGGHKDSQCQPADNSMQVEYDETKLDTGKIIEAVEHAGYGASVKEDGKQQ